MKHTLWEQIKSVSTLLGSVFCISLITGCNTIDPVNYETVKMPPAMNYYASNTQLAQNNDATNSRTPADAITQSGNTQQAFNSSRDIISRKSIMAELRKKGVPVVPTVNDHKYIVPSHQWVQANYHSYFKWFLHYLSAGYQADGMDCDNYANFYQQNLVLANLKAGGARYGDVPCANIVVNQWDKKIYHALNLIRTSHGWHVVEPQDGTTIPLADYRYKKHITKIVF